MLMTNSLHLKGPMAAGEQGWRSRQGNRDHRDRDLRPLPCAVAPSHLEEASEFDNREHFYKQSLFNDRTLGFIW